ncbi:histidine kinase [Fluviicola sp.]|uniref:sensor histidine kinase n=1 Tax=Fluviicola sp. TaxID=1917219 RepID=UPI0031D4ACF5
MTTKSRKNSFLSNNRKRFLFTISAFLLMYLVAYIIDPFSEHWYHFFDRDFSEIAEDWTITLLVCLAISESSITVSNQLNKYLLWTDSPILRLAVETALNVLLVLVINWLVSLWCLQQLPDASRYIPSLEERRGFLQWVTVSVIISFMIMGINIGNYLISNWKNEVLRVAELNQSVVESELQALKLQLDPHFVFNNLSALSELILEDQELGYNYAENFSRIYRYMLVNSKKDMISLQDELMFLDSYMFLIRNRLGAGVMFEIAVNPECSSLMMPPLTLQMLVENALKHNRTNKKEPLIVRIYTNDLCELVVENIRLPLERTHDSSGIGIQNIIRRYNLLSEKEPKIVKGPHLFQVIIPLLKR